MGGKPVLTGRHDGGGHPAAHLFRVGGAAEDNDGALVPHLLPDDLAQAERGVLLDALTNADQNGPVLDQRGQFLGGGADGEGGGDQHHHVAVRHTGDVRRQMEFLRNGHSLEHGVLMGLLELVGLLLEIGP